MLLCSQRSTFCCGSEDLKLYLITYQVWDGKHGMQRFVFGIGILSKINFFWYWPLQHQVSNRSSGQSWVHGREPDHHDKLDLSYVASTRKWCHLIQCWLGKAGLPSTYKFTWTWAKTWGLNKCFFTFSPVLQLLLRLREVELNRGGGDLRESKSHKGFTSPWNSAPHSLKAFDSVLWSLTFWMDTVL